MKNSLALLLSLLVLAWGCSSSKVVVKEGEEENEEVREFQTPFKVMNAKTKTVPWWMNEPQAWAEKYDKRDFDKNRYFVAETEPKTNKTIACQLAKAMASAEVASEITQFIKQSVAQSIQGDAAEQLDEYITSTLAKEVQTFIVGARVHRTYWEYRKYQKELGATKDMNGYVCHALVKIKRQNLERAITRAQKKLEQEASPEVKENVKEALKDAAKKFAELDK